MNKRQFKASEFINSIYRNGKKPVSLEYCDDDAVYNITCTLNWTKDQKNDFINKINNFDKDIKSLPKFSRKDSIVIFNKYFSNTKKQIFKEDLKQRVYRLNKLYDVGTPKLIVDNELQLIITLLILNNYALKDSIVVEVSENLKQYK